MTLPQLLVDGEHRVEGGVVLGVQGDRGADLGGGLDDRADVGEGQLVAAREFISEPGGLSVEGGGGRREGLAEHRQLDGHLGLGAEAQVLEACDQLEVGVARGGGLLGGGDVLADHVEGDFEAPAAGVHDDRHDVVDALTGDEPVDDLLRAGGCRDETAHPVAARRGENHGTQHGAPPQTSRQDHRET
jgi:hypothetical protein